MIEKKVKVTNKGSITIPADLRKKFHIKGGDYVIVQEDEKGNIFIKKIESANGLRNKALKVENFKEIYKKSREEDLKIER
ncbi:MAG: AbrB/MazE/SpoVT family DNA-binding domain-containing protein [Candidatus Lokiarchaeota archaeon]